MGGDDHRGGLPGLRPAQDVEVRGVPDNRVGVPGHLRRLSFDDHRMEPGGHEFVVGQAADTATADDDHMSRFGVRMAERGIVTVDLLPGAGEDEEALAVDPAVRLRRHQPPVIPEADHAQAAALPDAALRKRLVEQRRAVGIGLRDQQAARFTDHVGLPVLGGDTARQGLGHPFIEPQHHARARQFQHVAAGRRGCGCHDGQGRCQFAHREGDVGVEGLRVRRHEHRGLVLAHAEVGFRIVQGAHGGLDPCVRQFQGGAGLRAQHDIGMAVLDQHRDQRCGDRIVLGEDDVPPGVLRQFAGSPGLGLRFHPWRVKEPDEGEGQDHQHEQHPAH